MGPGWNAAGEDSGLLQEETFDSCKRKEWIAAGGQSGLQQENKVDCCTEVFRTM
jgi:hypothetical protein